jgi:cell division protein FtsL
MRKSIYTIMLVAAILLAISVNVSAQQAPSYATQSDLDAVSQRLDNHLRASRRPSKLRKEVNELQHQMGQVAENQKKALDAQDTRDKNQDADISAVEGRTTNLEGRMDHVTHREDNNRFWIWFIAIGAAVLFLGAFILIYANIGHTNNAANVAHGAMNLAGQADLRARQARQSARGAHRRIGRLNVRVGAVEGLAATAMNPPSITGIVNIASGNNEVPAAGGATVRLTGVNFTTVPAITVNGVNAANITLISPTTVDFTAPAGTAGQVAFVAANFGGRVASTMFRYL